MEKPIVRIELAPGARVEKRLNAWKQATWEMPIVYICADGQRIRGRDSYRLKRDAMAGAASYPRTPAEGEWTAQLDDNGHCTSTIWAPFAHLRMLRSA